MVLLSFSELAVMHDLRLIHTDLKPENILFVSPEYVKVPDFKVFCAFMIFGFQIVFYFFLFLFVFEHRCLTVCEAILMNCKLGYFLSFLVICRLHPGHQKRGPFTRDCQSQVLLRSLILAAQLMNTKITTTLSLPGIIGHLRLFLVCRYFHYTHITVTLVSFYVFILGVSFKCNLFIIFKDLGGVSLVTYGVLDAFWLSYARYVNKLNSEVMRLFRILID